MKKLHNRNYVVVFYIVHTKYGAIIAPTPQICQAILNKYIFLVILQYKMAAQNRLMHQM